jgi:Domain of unknown function (DUF4145)
MPERDPDGLPTSTDPSGPCPRCGRTSNFSMLYGPFAVTFTQLDPSGGGRLAAEEVAVFECSGCRQCTVVVERNVGPPGAPARTIEGIHWWPAPGAADLDPDIPEPVASAFSEGMRALSANCPRAAAVMFRGMLTEVVRDKGSEAVQKASSLVQQLKVMEQEGTLYPSLVEWAAEIRLVANAAAHVDELQPVDQAEAADLSRLCRQLITMVYETPARIRRARRARSSP